VNPAGPAGGESEQAAAPGGPAPDPFGQQASPGSPGDQAPGPYGQQPFPAAPVPPKRRRGLILAIVGAGVVVLAAIIVIAVVLGGLVSTVNLRVRTPAPATAGGLARDFTDEGNPRFQASMAQFHGHYAGFLHSHVTSYATAIYTNAAAGAPASTASLALLYLGFNASTPTTDTSGALKAAIAGMSRQLQNQQYLPVTGLPAGMSAECVTGFSASRPLSAGNPVSACAWVTLNTFAVFVALTEGTSGQELAGLMKKMRPDLVRG